jgi:hypothetical protein
MPPKVEGSNRTLLFRNLDERVKANDLAKFLSQFATVSQNPFLFIFFNVIADSFSLLQVLKVNIPAPDNEPLGYAFVEFFSDEDAARVFEHVRDPRCPVLPEVNCRLSVHYPMLFESDQSRVPSSQKPRVWAGLRSFGRIHVGAVPFLAAVIAFVTIVLCFFLAKRGGRIPDDLLVVPISFAAVGSPERFVYAAGISAVTGLLLFVAFVLDPFFRFLAAELPADRRAYVLGARVSGPLASLGLILQAIVPLDDSASHLLGTTPELAVLTLQSTVHQAAASLFFMAGTLHVYCVVNVLAACRDVPGITTFFAVSPDSYRTKYTCLLVLLLIPLAIVLHPAAVHIVGVSIDLSFDLRLLANAAAQFITVGSMLAFFVSYRYELSSIHFSQFLGSRGNFDRAMRPPAPPPNVRAPAVSNAASKKDQ